MAQADRVLTIEEVFAGHVTQAYIDLKEQRAIVGRHLSRVNEHIEDMEDGMEIAPENPKFAKGLEKDLAKKAKLDRQYKELTEKMEKTP